jgi:hypothetical protein
VAPLFVHGDGRGSYGCDAVVPPLYLSEQEARSIIVEEAKKAGIHFDPGLRDQTTVQIGSRGQTLSFEFDGKDPKKNISFYFLSAKQADRLGTAANFEIERHGSVYTVDGKEQALAIRAELDKQPRNGYVATFYEPHKYEDKTGDFSKKEAKHFDREALREQVRDFVKWLKAQGVI